MVASVAELSRSRSELINVIFFASFRQLLLPSSAGRRTTCRREWLHNTALPPSIRLLPIDTSGSNGTDAAAPSCVLTDHKDLRAPLPAVKPTLRYGSMPYSRGPGCRDTRLRPHRPSERDEETQ